jgi:hypothetical protein
MRKKQSSEANEGPSAGPCFWRIGRFDMDFPSRYLDCLHYDRCLNHAIERNWPSWRCPAGCLGYEFDFECLRVMSVNASLSGVDIPEYWINDDFA